MNISIVSIVALISCASFGKTSHSTPTESSTLAQDIFYLIEVSHLHEGYPEYHYVERHIMLDAVLFLAKKNNRSTYSPLKNSSRLFFKALDRYTIREGSTDLDMTLCYEFSDTALVSMMFFQELVSASQDSLLKIYEAKKTTVENILSQLPENLIYNSPNQEFRLTFYRLRGTVKLCSSLVGPALQKICFIEEVSYVEKPTEVEIEKLGSLLRLGKGVRKIDD